MPRKSERRLAALERLHELVELLPALALPETAADAYGTIRAELELKGQRIGNNDLWVAAHALAAGLILVTNNERVSPGTRSENTELGSLGVISIGSS